MYTGWLECGHWCSGSACGASELTYTLIWLLQTMTVRSVNEMNSSANTFVPIRLATRKASSISTPMMAANGQNMNEHNIYIVIIHHISLLEQDNKLQSKWSKQKSIFYQQNQSWNYFRSIPTYVTTIPQSYRQADGRTNCRSNTALCLASRGKNHDVCW